MITKELRAIERARTICDARAKWDARTISQARLAFAAVSALAALNACGFTPQGGFLRSAVADRGREAAAAGLENAEWFLCRAAPVGAIKDRYGASLERMDAYNVMCNPAWVPIPPQPE